MKKRIAVLLGDGAGIGPEQVAKCAISGFLTEHCDPIILGDKRIFDRALRIVGGEEYSYTVIENFEDMKFNGQPIFYDMKNLDPADFKIGTVNLYTGKATVEQIDLAIQMWRDKLVGAILFAPFNKASTATTASCLICVRFFTIPASAVRSTICRMCSPPVLPVTFP